MSIALNILAGISLLVLIIAFVWALVLMINPPNSGSTDPEFDERIEELQNLLDSRREENLE